MVYFKNQKPFQKTLTTQGNYHFFITTLFYFSSCQIFIKSKIVHGLEKSGSRMS